MSADLVHAAGVAALILIAVEFLALLAVLAAYTRETARRARAARRIETLYSARCPDDLSNIYNRPEDKP